MCGKVAMAKQRRCLVAQWQPTCLVVSRWLASARCPSRTSSVSFSSTLASAKTSRLSAKQSISGTSSLMRMASLVLLLTTVNGVSGLVRLTTSSVQMKSSKATSTSTNFATLSMNSAATATHAAQRSLLTIRRLSALLALLVILGYSLCLGLMATLTLWFQLGQTTWSSASHWTSLVKAWMSLGDQTVHWHRQTDSWRLRHQRLWASRRHQAVGELIT